jgi:hypothetical protein
MNKFQLIYAVSGKSLFIPGRESHSTGLGGLKVLGLRPRTFNVLLRPVKDNFHDSTCKELLLFVRVNSELFFQYYRHLICWCCSLESTCSGASWCCFEKRVEPYIPGVPELTPFP